MSVVETGFQHAVVNGDDGKGERPGILHGLECADAAGRLFRHADDMPHEFRPFHCGKTGEARTVIDDDVRLNLIQ